ncbi:MAG TPA: universal stress protein [Burkholderiales bacterium]|nr:universal stress protein [Burkholderiales bacterium]
MTLKRVVVGIDPRPQDRVALEAAAQLAGRLQAELVGLFVEDIDLLRLAALPFAREIGFPSATARALDIEAMERSLRALADDIQRTMAAIAARAPVPWSFRVTRGALMRELRAAAAPGDIVVTGALGLSLPPPLSVLCATSTPPEAVVPAAAALARSAGRRVEIVLLDGDDEATRRWEDAARALLAAQGGHLELRSVAAGREKDEGRAKGGPARGNR